MSRLMYRMIRDAGVNRAYSRCHTPGGSRNTWRPPVRVERDRQQCSFYCTEQLFLHVLTTVMKINPPADDQVLTATEVNRTLQRVNPRKAAGPNGIPA